MSAPHREQLKNNASTTLDGGIDDTVTSIDVADGSVFPSNGDFRLICGTEIMLCTARSTNTLTVVRGYESTAAAAHADGAVISHIITADSVDRLLKDNVPLAGYSGFPALNRIVDDSGNVIDSSDFTITNQGTATISDQGGTIALRLPPNNSGENVRVLSRTAPAAPYSYIAAFQYISVALFDGSISGFGLGFRESGTGKITAIVFSCDTGTVGLKNGLKVVVYSWNSATSFDSAEQADKPFGYAGSALWAKIEDDNTNLKFSVSADGVEFVQFLSMPRTDFMAGGPDEVCFIGSTVGNPSIDIIGRLVHFSRAS